MALWWWRSLKGSVGESSCSLEAAGVDFTAAGLEVGGLGETPSAHTAASTAWTGTSLITSNHWDTGAAKFTSYPLARCVLGMLQKPETRKVQPELSQISALFDPDQHFLPGSLQIRQGKD